MTTFTERTKSSTTTLNPRLKAGSAWKYNDTDIKYDSVTEPNSGLSVKYNALGTAPVFTERAKSSTVTLTERTKS